MNEETSRKKTGAPEWATEPLDRFIPQLERLEHVVRLSLIGISRLQGFPELMKVLAEVDEKHRTPEHEKVIVTAQRDADLAEREIATGFPILFANALVALWSLLEETIRATVAAWLKNDPTVWQVDVIAKLRVRLGEYERLSKEERYYYVAELMESETSAGLRNGVARFEAMLKPLSLDGPVPDELRKDMFELGQVRNVIVHRGGRIDRQLTNSCPWLNFEVGNELSIKKEQFDQYLKAVQNYVLLIVCRIGEHFGKDLTMRKKSVFTEYGE